MPRSPPAWASSLFYRLLEEICGWIPGQNSLKYLFVMRLRRLSFVQDSGANSTVPRNPCALSALSRWPLGQRRSITEEPFQTGFAEGESLSRRGRFDADRPLRKPIRPSRATDSARIHPQISLRRHILRADPNSPCEVPAPRPREVPASGHLTTGQHALVDDEG